MIEANVLPKGWETASLAQCTSRITDGTHLPPQFVEIGIPFIFIKHIIKGRLIFDDTKFISEKTWREFQERCPVEPGDILYSAVGSYGVAVVVSTEQPFSFQRHIAHIKPQPGFDSKYLAYFLNSPYGLSQAHRVAKGVAQKTVTLGDLKQFRVLLAPFNEQRRIVAKIEELFSDLDAGVAALTRGKANLKRYRAAVLKAAVEGKLTEEWRAKHPDTEPASSLLARILTERRQKWEADQLAKFAASRKETPKGWREKYVEPTSADTTHLPELPAGWCWASLGQLLIESPQNGAYYPRSKYGSGHAIIRIDDYQQFWSRGVELLQRVNAPQHDQVTYGLDENDIVINRVNSLSHLGKVLLVEPRHLPAIFESNMMKLRPCKQSASVFLRDYLQSFNGTQRLIANAKWAVNQASINQQDVQATPVPLPSLEEQSAVAREVAEKLSLIEAAETAIGHGLLRAARLRQSILKDAFEGKLVPQDITDEPAEKLLERIHHQRDTIKQSSNGDAGPRRAGRPRKTRPALPLFAQDDGDDEGGDS